MSATNIIHEYLDLMDAQRKAVFEALEGLHEEKVWLRPAQREWSIGEILDHTRALNASFLPMLRFFWFFMRGLAKRSRRKPYATQIDDVYHRPTFPMNVGWLWPPKYTPKKPATLAKIEAALAEVHAQYRNFYQDKDPDLLGHINVHDPAIGRLNLILVLRVGIYHDQLHYDDVIGLINEVRRYTTPVA